MTHPGHSARPLAVVLLAAGKGTRMKSQTPKVLHRVLGRTLLEWVLESTGPLGAEKTLAVVGHGAELVEASLPPGVEVAVQHEQRGSGDALAAALPALEGFEGDVLVVNGDGILFTTSTLGIVVEEHRGSGSVASSLGIEARTLADLPYGRLISTEDGQLDRVVEAVDASPDELRINLLNAGVYCFEARSLRENLPSLSADNAKGELYITELFEIARAAGQRTKVVVAGDERELLGVNNRADLAEAATVLQERIIERLMLEGVTFVMPETSLVEPDVVIEPDAVVEPGCILRGATHVSKGAVIGPQTSLIDTSVGARASVVRSHCIQAAVGDDASVGPYAYLRPGTDLRADAKVGAFVEIKKSVVGERSKVPHLSYIGDATIGTDSNIGAGTITANYRPELGRGKQPTTFGNNVRTGSDNVFVAPVTVGDGAFTAAGSIVVEDVPAGALAIARARQVNLEDYAGRVQHKQTVRATDVSPS